MELNAKKSVPWKTKASDSGNDNERMLFFCWKSEPKKNRIHCMKSGRVIKRNSEHRRINHINCHFNVLHSCSHFASAMICLCEFAYWIIWQTPQRSNYFSYGNIMLMVHGFHSLVLRSFGSFLCCCSRSLSFVRFKHTLDRFFPWFARANFFPPCRVYNKLGVMLSPRYAPNFYIFLVNGLHRP